MKAVKRALILLLAALLAFGLAAAGAEATDPPKPTDGPNNRDAGAGEQAEGEEADAGAEDGEAGGETEPAETVEPDDAVRAIEWDPAWEYAAFSKIHTDPAMLYRSPAEHRKDIVVCVNAGHGTAGGTKVKTQCHPDGSAKVTGGSTGQGAYEAIAVSAGMEFLDGTPEPAATLSLALLVKKALLEAGYDVLMIRDTDDVQLDNIARTVMANNNADCHIALHYDSSTSDKGLFYCSVPDVASYRAMEPVASHWREHLALGDAMVEAARADGVKVYAGGAFPIDLTQTSYSTVPSIDLEVGDKGSDYSEAAQRLIARAVVDGVDIFFAQAEEAAQPGKDDEHD